MGRLLSLKKTRGGTWTARVSTTEGTKLKPYQLEGLQWLVSLDQNGISGILGSLRKLDWCQPVSVRFTIGDFDISGPICVYTRCPRCRDPLFIKSNNDLNTFAKEIKLNPSTYFFSDAFWRVSIKTWGWCESFNLIRRPNIWPKVLYWESNILAKVHLSMSL